MSAPSGLLAGALFATGLLLVALAASLAFTASHWLKRVLGALMAQIAAILATVAIGAPAPLAAVGLGACFAAMLLGAALLVRLHEEYRTLEHAEIDAMETESEPAEPGS